MFCFLFGHALPPTTAQLTAAMEQPAFSCWRCAHMVMWSDMHRRIRNMRAEYLRRIRANLVTGKRPANDDSMTTVS